MKKITINVFAFILLTMFALEVQAQYTNVWTEDGTYKISTYNVTPQLFMTIDGTTGDLVWAEELPDDNPTQVWAIVDHRQPSGTGYMEITANVPGVGDFTMTADQASINGKNIRISVRPGLPVDDTTDPNYGYDQFQRRRTSDFGGPGNNALFVKVPGEGGSRYGVIPTTAGESVQFDGGGIDALEFHLIATLSTEAFEASSIFIANPVKDKLSIKGLTQNINSVAVYSLVGQEVISKKLNGEPSLSLDISTLTKGVYIVDFKGENGSFTKKIVKQ